MPGWTTPTSLGRAGFIANYDSIQRNIGRQIDWANVGAWAVNATTGKKELPAGTICYDSALNGYAIPRRDAPGLEKAQYILETRAIEDAPYVPGPGWYGCIVGGVIYQNLLPDKAELNFATMLTELQDTTNGTMGFVFETYADNTTAT